MISDQHLPPAVSVISGVDPFSVDLAVLHVWQPVEAGVPRYARAAAEFQAAGGWRVHVACPDGDDAPPGVHGHVWESRRNPARGVRSESRALAAIIAETDPDVVVAHSAKAGLVTRLTVRGSRPTVFVPHAWSHLALPRPAQPIAIAWERVAARWTNAVVAVGEREAELGVRHRIRAPYFVVPNPVPPGWTPVTDADRTAARDSLGLPSGPLAVCVGRLSRQKGQDVLVAAWPEVRRAVPEATLVLVGDGPDAESLQEAAGPGVRLVGRSDDPRSYLAAADLAVLPSRWEGLSLSMLEAMASARGLVVTDVAGAEVVGRSGAGAVVPVGDGAALAAAVVDRLAGRIDPDEEGRRGAAHVREHHDLTTAMARLAAVISRAHAFGR